MSYRDLSTLDRDICQPLGRILQEAFDDGIACRVNITFNSTLAEGDIIGFQVRPAANEKETSTGGTATANCYGIQVMPRFNDDVPGASLSGIFSNPILKGECATTGGDLTGDFRGVEIKMEAEKATCNRTVAGATSAIQVMRKLPSDFTSDGGIYVMKVDAKHYGDGASWTAFVNLPDDNQLANDAEDKTSTSTTPGWIKAKIGTKTGYIPVYELST